jgi:pSer/pThr/pTyr-binding forkhead associated (FHA) protein/tetratricopeptide (TPR) repeat protein
VLKVFLHGREIKEVALEDGREYSFGRGKECDIALTEGEGISRHHFKIGQVNGDWTAQVQAKFGELQSAGQPVQSIALEDSSVFKLGYYDFRFQRMTTELVAAAGDGLARSVSHSQTPQRYDASQPNLHAVEEFDGNDEATRVAQATSVVPFLRIVDDAGRENRIALNGRKWVAGRDDSSDIVLDDRKASRKHFELTASPQGYFVRDLGSANGTILNGSRLATDELKPIRSGDVLQVGKLTVHFEVRDPSFEKKVLNIPKEAFTQPVAAPIILSHAHNTSDALTNASLVNGAPGAPGAQSQSQTQMQNPPAPIQPVFEIINFPMVAGGGGALKLPGNVGAPYDWPELADPSADAKKKKMRFYLIVAAVIVPIVAYLQYTPEQKAPAKTVKKAVVNDAFSGLSPQNQQRVKEIYVLGQNLFMQGKLALAAEQFKQLHEILPDGFENSKRMAEECRAQVQQEENLRYLEQQKKIAEQNRLAVERNLKECEPIANSTYNSEDLKACLAPTFERDPSNPMIQSMLGRIDARVAERDKSNKQKKDYADRVARGRSLFQKAQDIEKRGEIYDAIEAYQRHIQSPYPDPTGLKAVSEKSIREIRQRIDSRVANAMSAAESEYAAGHLKTAISRVLEAKAIDPRNDRAAQLHAKIRHDLDLKMRDLYEQATISEGLGNVDDAKISWKKILEADHPDGTYYKRAKSKLQAYGGV